MVDEKALLSGKEIFGVLNTSEEGLSSAEAEKRLGEYGFNELKKKRDFTSLKIFVSQFTSFFVIILVIAGIIAFLLDDYLDSAGIFAVVIINGIIGFVQEHKAEHAIKSLKKMVSEKAVVLRDKKRREVLARYLTPGDIVVIEEGMRVPADIKIIENFSVKADESVLTGESEAVSKKIAKNITKENYSQSILFSNTLVVSGTGLGVVYATGMETEFGKIAELVMESEKEQTLLDRQINDLAKKFGIVILAIVTVLFLLGVFRQIDIVEMFMVSVSLAVSAIPEGLPIVVTLTLALGVQAIAKKRAIVRKMAAIESLGAATIICSDKTGTLTMNEMTVKKIFADGIETGVPGEGYSAGEPLKIKKKGPAAGKLFQICANSNNSFIEFDSKRNAEVTIGDPTEIALKVLAKKAESDARLKKIHENPFTSERKMMSTVHIVGNREELFLKGAPEEVLKICSKKLSAGKETFFTGPQKKEILEKSSEWCGSSLRVLALAYREIGKAGAGKIVDTSDGYYMKKYAEENMVFVGLVGMLDPLRPEARDALKLAQQAGIKVKIITGDNLLTTKAIAKSAGLRAESSFEGREIDAMNDNELKEALGKANIFARVSPNHKYRIVSMLKEMGEIVAVTGDGVNDAPALKKADIGIAMGIKGTEVSKQAADVVLQDDNFATIVSIIREGRRVYANIISFVKFMISTNFVLLGIVGFAALAGLPLPLIPLQILWINIATDSLPALALGAEKAEKGIMEKKPHEKGENILKKFLLFIAIATILQTLGYIFFFEYGLSKDAALGIDTFNLSAHSHARTIIFTGIVLFEIVCVFNCRGIKKSLLNGGFFENKKLIVAVGASLIAHLLIVYAPPMQEIFRTTPLGLNEWAIIALVASPVVFLPEMTEFARKILGIKSSE